MPQKFAGLESQAGGRQAFDENFERNPVGNHPNALGRTLSGRGQELFPRFRRPAEVLLIQGVDGAVDVLAWGFENDETGVAFGTLFEDGGGLLPELRLRPGG